MAARRFRVAEDRVYAGTARGTVVAALSRHTATEERSPSSLAATTANSGKPGRDFQHQQVGARTVAGDDVIKAQNDLTVTPQRQHIQAAGGGPCPCGAQHDIGKTILTKAGSGTGANDTTASAKGSAGSQRGLGHSQR